MAEEKNKYNEAYDEGYDRGKTDGGMESFTHNLANFTFPWEDQKEHDSFEAGYKDGASDKYDDKDSHYSGGTSESSGK